MKKLIITFLICINSVGMAFALKPIEKFSIYGCVTQGYMKTDANNYLLDSKDGSFEMREILFTFSSKMTHNIQVGAQIASIDLGDTGNNEPILDWAFGDAQLSRYFGVRAGRIKSGGIGFYNETQDIDVVRTSIFLPPSVYNPLLRDSRLAIDGFSFYGTIDLAFLNRLSYTFSLGTNPITEDGMIYRYIDNIGMLKEFDISSGYTYIGGITWSLPIKGLKIGLSFLKSKIEASGNMRLNPAWFDAFEPIELMSNFDLKVEELASLDLDAARKLKVKEPMEFRVDPYQMTIYSIEYSFENLTLASEVASLSNTQKVYMAGKPGAKEKEQNPLGGYVSASYRFLDWLELGLCYGMYFENEDDMDGKKKVEEYEEMRVKAHSDVEEFDSIIPAAVIDSVDNLFDELSAPDFAAWQHMTTFTSRFDITDNLVFKIEYSLVNGTALLSLLDNPDFMALKENWSIFATKMTFVF